MRNGWDTFVLSSSLLFSVAMMLSCAPEPAELLKAYENTFNNYDVNRVMDFYAEDIRFEVVGEFVKAGREEVRELAKWDDVLNCQLTFTDLVVSGDTVRCKAIERNDWLQLAGVEEAYYGANTIIFRGVLITSITAELTQESARAIGEAFQAITEWASKERSQALAELMPEGEFVYSEETAKGWLALLREWQEETKP